MVKISTHLLQVIYWYADGYFPSCPRFFENSEFDQLTLLCAVHFFPCNRARFPSCVWWFIKSMRRCWSIISHLFNVILSGFLILTMPADTINLEWLVSSSYTIAISTIYIARISSFSCLSNNCWNLSITPSIDLFFRSSLNHLKNPGHRLSHFLSRDTNFSEDSWASEDSARHIHIILLFFHHKYHLIFLPYTTQKMKFSIKNIFSKYDQIRSFLNPQTKSSMENFIFCAVLARSLSFSLQSNFCKRQFIFCSSLCIKWRTQYKCWMSGNIDVTNPWRIPSIMSIRISRTDRVLMSQACISSPNLLNVFTSFVKWNIDGPRYTGPRFPCGVVDYSLISIARISEPHVAKIICCIKTDPLLFTQQKFTMSFIWRLKARKKNEPFFITTLSIKSISFKLFIRS